MRRYLKRRSKVKLKRRRYSLLNSYNLERFQKLGKTEGLCKILKKGLVIFNRRSMTIEVIQRVSKDPRDAPVSSHRDLE